MRIVLGCLQHNGLIVRHCRHSCLPLHLHQGQAKRPEVGSPSRSAFCNTKNDLSTAATLTFPVVHSPVLLSTDASDVAIGAVLEQVVNGSPCPLAFFSRKLSKAESGYYTFDPSSRPQSLRRCSPLPTLKGHLYLFTVIDRSTGWPEVIPMELATSASCTSALLSGWIAKFGIPEHVTSDRGTTFTSQLWTPLANLMDITLHQTTAYNPAANGMVESFHCTLKVALMSRCKDSNLFTQLPWVLQGLKTNLKEARDLSAAEMVYGDPLVVPSEFFPFCNVLR
ncbi:uncharacterized protein [Palaemon carinicauda]|uniref:uncharacterized protein n=1 Tax=Palaemon carinicauda TaxID=392227 RepID=UPI0035B66939